MPLNPPGFSPPKWPRLGRRRDTGLPAGSLAPLPTEIPLCWLSSPVMLRLEQPYTTAAVTRAGGSIPYRNSSAANLAEYGDFSFTADLSTPTSADATNLAHWTVSYQSVPRMRSPQLAINLMYRSDSEKVMLLRIPRWSRIKLTGVPPEFPEGASSLVVAGMKHQISLGGRMLYITTAPVVGTTTPGGLLLPGTSGSYASTPDVSALDIVGDIDLRADLSMDSWNPASNASPLTKWGGAGSRSCLLQITTTGKIAFTWSTNGTATLSATSTISPTVADGQRLAIRATLDVDNGAAGKTVTFYTAASIDGPWTQLGATVTTGGVTSIFASPSALEVGGHTGGTANLFTGTVHAAEVRDGIDGPPAAAPRFKDQPVGTTGFTDSPGRPWTINGAAQIRAPISMPGPWFRYGSSAWGGTDIIPF